MLRFPNALRAWPSEAFPRILKSEIENLDTRALPLHEGTSQGGFVDDAPISAIVLTSTDEGHAILADVGVFFTEVVAACSCGDEPEAINGYCRLRIRIDKASAGAKVHAVPD